MRPHIPVSGLQDNINTAYPPASHAKYIRPTSLQKLESDLMSVVRKTPDRHSDTNRFPELSHYGS